MRVSQPPRRRNGQLPCSHRCLAGDVNGLGRAAEEACSRMCRCRSCRRGS